MTTTSPRAVIYTRISQDALGLEKGVTSQLDECRAYAARLGCDVVDVITDNDISALTAGKRPGYERLLQMIRNGDVDQVIAFQMSRLWRNRVERAQGIEVLKDARCSVAFSKGQTFDFTSASGRGIAGMLGEVDTMESELKSERVLLDVARRVEAGLPNGTIPFGWTRSYEFNAQGKRTRVLGDVHHPEQAPIVAEVCHRLLAGQTLVAVTRWLNESGIPAPRAGYNLRHRDRGITNADGQQWGKTSVRKLALRPANAGLLVHHKGRPDEQVKPTEYIEPIISVDEHHRLKAMLATNAGAGITRPGGRKHLLSWGIGECGVCHGVLRSKPARGVPLYVCDAKGCVGRNQQRVDDLVISLLTQRLANANDIALLVNDDAAADGLMSRHKAIAGELLQNMEDKDAKVITREQFLDSNRRLVAELAHVEQQMKATAPSVPVELLTAVAGEHAEERFAALDVSQQRVLAEYLLERVLINPTRRGPGFNEADVDPQWRRVIGLD